MIFCFSHTKLQTSTFSVAQVSDVCMTAMLALLIQKEALKR
jgi:hypothetical protein